jgi:ABC transporter substrate binding protein
MKIRRAQDIATAFESLNPQADALYVVQDALVVANRTAIMAFALTRRLPTIFSARDFVQAGGLLSYGPNYPGVFRRAADYVDKIMRGAKPSDLPIEQPNQIRFGYQPDDTESARRQYSRKAARHRRRGDRIMRSVHLICCTAYVGSWHFATVRCEPSIRSLWES